MFDIEVLNKLREKEAMLMKQLRDVQDAIERFGGSERLDQTITVDKASEYLEILGEVNDYDIYATYNNKILWVLRKLKRPAYVKEIVEYMLKSGETANKEALLRRIKHNASKMYRNEMLDADTTNRQYKYSIRKNIIRQIVFK